MDGDLKNRGDSDHRPIFHVLDAGPCANVETGVPRPVEPTMVMSEPGRPGAAVSSKRTWRRRPVPHQIPRREVTIAVACASVASRISLPTESRTSTRAHTSGSGAACWVRRVPRASVNCAPR